MAKRKTGDSELDKVLEEGNKNDLGKLRYDLVSVAASEGLVEVLTHGAQKYGDRNWEKGIKYSRVYAALQRHLNAFWGRETIDDESGFHHLAHAACELMFLQEFESYDDYQEFDDRPTHIE